MSRSETLHDRDVILVSPQRWGGMWVSKHWIASELARHNRVLFVEPPVWVAGLAKRPGTITLDGPRLARRLRRVAENLHVHAPLLLPERWFGAHAEALTAQVRRQVRRLGLRDAILLNFSTNHFYNRALGDAVSVHYCVDPPFPGPGEERFEELTCRKSDVIFAISDAYRRKLAVHDPEKPIHVVPHGIAFEDARRVHDDPAEAPPPELARLRGPVFGFVGSVHDAYVDVGLLESVSRARPDYQFVLIGPYRNNPIGPDLSARGLRRLRALPNVHLLGFRPYRRLAHYVKHFDAGLVLMEVDRFERAHETRRRNHFKLLHYLAQGKPIVIPDVFEVDAIRDLVYVARDREEYVAHLDAALAEGEGLRPRRVEYASGFSYAKVLERIAAPIREFEARRRA